MPSNRQILLDNRPEGEATAGNFKLVTTDTPALKDGEVLVRYAKHELPNSQVFDERALGVGVRVMVNIIEQSAFF